MVLISWVKCMGPEQGMCMARIGRHAAAWQHEELSQLQERSAHICCSCIGVGPILQQGLHHPGIPMHGCLMQSSTALHMPKQAS